MTALLLASSAGWACGGYAAADKIAYASRVGTSAAAVSVLMTLLAAVFVWRRGISWRILAPMVVVCAAHPGLWMNPAAADCGQQMTMASVVFTLQSAALLGWVLARPSVARKLREEAEAATRVVVVED
ncbi:MAG: hypothetical protein ACI8S6_000406 [Myxococcota bacterium]